MFHRSIEEGGHRALREPERRELGGDEAKLKKTRTEALLRMMLLRLLSEKLMELHLPVDVVGFEIHPGRWLCQGSAPSYPGTKCSRRRSEGGASH